MFSGPYGNMVAHAQNWHSTLAQEKTEDLMCWEYFRAWYHLKKRKTVSLIVCKPACEHSNSTGDNIAHFNQ